WVRSVVQHRNGRLAQGLRDVTRAVRRPQSVRAAALEWANRQQERWHAAEQARSRAEKYVEWTPILDGEYVDASGWTFRELTDSDSLDTEGREMHHCVAEYADGCSLGKSHIFSVVGPQGERATLEVQGETFLVLQLRGPCNQAVSEDCQKAAQRFAQGLRRRLRRGVIQKGNAGDLLTAPKPPAPGRPEAVLRSPLHPRHPPAR
ncbi:PcfJ domain-containing protein, partial [Acidithiobacillus caldus]